MRGDFLQGVNRGQKVNSMASRRVELLFTHHPPEFPESGFSSLDSESETLLLSKTIPSLVQPCKTRPSPRLRQVLYRETRYLES